MEKVTNFLRHSELFCDLPKEKLQEIFSIGHIESYDAGETIISTGEVSDDLYVVKEGMVEVLVTGGNLPDVPGAPQLTPLVQLGQGQVFGEMALIDRGERSATIRALEDGTELFVIPREDFWTLCDADHHIGYIVMRNIAFDLSFKLRHRNLRQFMSGTV
jgi:CRP-like cAMP-binding protein